MENNKIVNNECILEKITKLPITIITEIFAYSSNFPISFIYIISKSKKLQSIILKSLERINSKNDLDSKSNEYILKYKITQKLYLKLLENTIFKKINNLPLTLPKLDEEQLNNNKYLNIVYNNFIELFDKYQSLKIYCNDNTFNKKRNKWFLKKISEINEEYFNNCIIIVDNIEDIESIIYLLYYNNYLNFKITLIVNKIKKENIKKIILEDEQINYYIEYPRSIILKRQLILSLLKLNINFYITSKENLKQLSNITYQSINDYKIKNNFSYRKHLSVDYCSFLNTNNIITNIINIENNNKNKIYKNKNINNQINKMTINKSNISFKEINSYLKEYQSLDIDSIVFQNILIENSFFNSLFGKFKSNNNYIYNNHYNTKNINNNNIFKFNKNILENNNKLIINFEKDFFEVNTNDKICLINSSEIITYIKNHLYIKILCLQNFPLEKLKCIENPFIEFIYINNFFNFDNGIILTINNINNRLPQLIKIKIKIKDFSNSKEFTFIKRNDINLNNITLNLLYDNIEINNIDIVNINWTIIPKKIYSIMKSFKGINTFAFNFAVIKKYENIDKSEQIDFVLNENYIFEEIKKIDINILEYLNFDNLMIYGHILNGIKTIKYYINNDEYENNDNNEIFEKSDILDLINNNINSFTESNLSIFFIKNYFLVPFIEDIILKINNKELYRFLFNCNTLLYNVNLYNIDINILNIIENEYIQNLNIYLFDDDKYDFSFKNKNKNEFNLRFIFNHIPSLKSIKINLINHKLFFKKSILPIMCFNIYYIDKNKKILVVDFGNNEIIYKNIKFQKFSNIIFNNCEGYIIFKIKDKQFIKIGNKKLIKPFDNDGNILKILLSLYIITFFIIIIINLLNLNFN